MIISPVKVPVIPYFNTQQAQILHKNLLTLPYQNDRAEFSFTGIFESSNVPIRLDQAQEHSGIHCPNCGVAMLSKHDYDCIVKKAMNASNAGQLVNIIENNKKFVPQRFLQIFEDIESLHNCEQMSIPEFREEMRKISYYKKRQVTHGVRDYLREYAQNFDVEKREKALENVDKIRTKQIYQVQKDLIMNFVKDLNLDTEQTNQVLANTLKPLFDANGYCMLFNYSKATEVPQDYYGVFIIQRIFYPSISQITPISKYPVHKNLSNNNVLVCQNCYQNQSKNVFWKTDNFPELKDNIKSYLTDISYLMGTGKMESSSDYLKAFSSISSKISKQRIIFTPSEIIGIQNMQRAVKRHERFIPIEQTQVDIPCAECGSVMLPHAKRKEIEKELKQCSNPYEYSQVLEKNMKYIGKNYRVLANIFLDIVKDNPNISNEKFIKKFLKKEAHYSDKAVENALRTFFSNRSYVADNYPPQCLEIYDTFSKRLLKYILHGNFNDYDVPALYNACLKDLDMKNYPVKPIYILMRNLKTISYKHLCATLDNKYNFNDKDSIYTILFHLFKSNVATVDHLIAEVKGGEGDKYNLIGLCKSCNRTKSQKNVYNWYLENKHLEPNLKKQLRIVDKMAKSGQIEGYDDWAKTIAQKVYEQTYGKLDLREDFK